MNYTNKPKFSKGFKYVEHDTKPPLAATSCDFDFDTIDLSGFNEDGPGVFDLLTCPGQAPLRSSMIHFRHA
jgi:hypothetical protein